MRYGIARAVWAGFDPVRMSLSGEGPSPLLEFALINFALSKAFFKDFECPFLIGVSMRHAATHHEEHHAKTEQEH
jgi:hypothetical protein